MLLHLNFPIRTQDAQSAKQSNEPLDSPVTLLERMGNINQPDESVRRATAVALGTKRSLDEVIPTRTRTRARPTILHPM